PPRGRWPSRRCADRRSPASAALAVLPCSCETLLERLRGRLRHDDGRCADQGQRIDAARLHHLELRKVAGREPQVHVEVGDDDEAALDAELGELLLQLLRLRRSDADLVGDDQPLLPEELGQHRPHRGAVHLAVDLLVVAPRLRRERATAADPDRSAGRAGAGAARALLAPRLAAAAADLRAGLLRFRARARVREIRRHHLVDQRLVVRRAEAHVGELERVAVALYFDFHRSYSAPFAPFAAGRTITRPFGAPGTAPLTSSRLRSASTRTTSRFVIVTRVAPMWPAMRLPGNTRPGVCRWPIEPGARCDTELPWLASWELKLWRLIVPA